MAYNFYYEFARDLISFSVDQKYEIIDENDNKFENRPRIMAVVSWKPLFLDTLYQFEQQHTNLSQNIFIFSSALYEWRKNADWI